MSDEITSIIEAVSTSLSAQETPAPAPPPSPDPVAPASPDASSTSASAASAPPTTTVAEPAPVAAVPAKKPSASKAEAALTPDQTEEAEVAAIAKELRAANPGLKGHIEVAQHQAVLTRTRNQLEAKIAETEKKYATYEAPEFQQRLQAFQIAETNPDRFLQILAAIPEYRSRLEAIVEEAVAERTRTAPAAGAPPVEEVEPQPDTLLEGGGMGYSTERANQLWEYRLRQARQEYDQKLAALEEGLAPIKEERQTREHIQQAYTRQGGILADARANWPLFSHYEPKIRAELAKPGNERMQLDQAYRVVVVNAERADRARIEADARTRIQAEINGHAASPRTLRPGLPPADGKADGGGDEIEMIIRNAARSLS